MLFRSQRSRPASVWTRWSGFALLFGALCLLGGCAAEAPPRPPRIQAPQNVTDLSVAQIGHDLLLRFQTPRFAADGRRLTKPIEVEIFREAETHGLVSPESFGTAKPWAVLKPPAVSRLAQSGEIRYRVSLSPQEFSRFENSTLAFMVVTLTRGFRGHPRLSEPSNVAQTRLLPVPAAIEDVEASQLRGGIQLRWAAPEQPGQSPPRLTGYTVLRASGAAPKSFALLAVTQAASYLDTHIQFGTEYLYIVRATFTEAGYTAETADSSPAIITPRPVFPPLPPRGLVAVFTGTSVELLWKPDSGPDIAGYNIYRKASGEPSMRLNQSLVRTPVYTDRSPLPPPPFIYWVTAVDLHHNESEPSAEATVRTR